MKNSPYFIDKDGYFYITFFISIKDISHLNDIEIFKLLGFENVRPQKITEKPGPRFSKPNIFGLKALIEISCTRKFLNGP